MKAIAVFQKAIHKLSKNFLRDSSLLNTSENTYVARYALVKLQALWVPTYCPTKEMVRFFLNI